MLTVEEIKKTISEIAPQYNLKKVTLFGSRANGTATENSDVDLIVDFPEDSTLFTVASVKICLEEIWNLEVDVIHGPKKDSWMLEIEKEVEIYAA